MKMSEKQNYQQHQTSMSLLLTLFRKTHSNHKVSGRIVSLILNRKPQNKRTESKSCKNYISVNMKVRIKLAYECYLGRRRDKRKTYQLSSR